MIPGWLFVATLTLSTMPTHAKEELSLRVSRFEEKDKRLTGFLLKTHLVENPDDCALQCALLPGCLSYDMKTVSSNSVSCLLNKESTDSLGKPLSAAPGYQHFVVVRPEVPGVFATVRGLNESRMWLAVAVVNGVKWCFLYDDWHASGNSNWKTFGTLGLNITAMTNRYFSDATNSSVQLTLYLGDGTMRLATLDVGYGGSDNWTTYTDYAGDSWSLLPPLSLASVHGPRAPALVTAALAVGNTTYLLHDDVVYELEAGHELGQVTEVYPLRAALYRNPFVNAPKGITAAVQLDPPLAMLFRGKRFVIYDVETKSYAGYGSM